MPTTCRRCRQAFEPEGLGPLGSYLVLELALLLLGVEALASGSWAGRGFGLLLLGLVLWALWHNHRARGASLCPACESGRDEAR